MAIGLIGTGILGSAVAEGLARGDEPVLAYNRTRAKLDALPQRVVRCETLAELVGGADSILVVLSDYAAVRDVIEQLGSLDGKVIYQVSTIGPDESRATCAIVNRCGGAYVESPVLGSRPEAREGRLQVMAASHDIPNVADDPLLRRLGTVLQLPAVGQAAALKLALNLLIGAETVAFSAALGFTRQWDVDTDQFMDLLRGSALYAKTFDKKLDKMLSSDFENPNFPLAHLSKDIKLFREAGESGADAVIGALSALLDQAVGEGYGDLDYSALHLSVDPPDK